MSASASGQQADGARTCLLCGGHHSPLCPAGDSCLDGAACAIGRRADGSWTLSMADDALEHYLRRWRQLRARPS